MPVATMRSKEPVQPVLQSADSTDVSDARSDLERLYRQLQPALLGHLRIANAS